LDQLYSFTRSHSCIDRLALLFGVQSRMSLCKAPPPSSLYRQYTLSSYTGGTLSAWLLAHHSRPVYWLDMLGLFADSTFLACFQVLHSLVYWRYNLALYSNVAVFVNLYLLLPAALPTCRLVPCLVHCLYSIVSSQGEEESFLLLFSFRFLS
jgi:hypothetical protein